MKAFRTTWIAVAVLVVLAAVVYWFEFRQQPAASSPESTSPELQVLKLDAASVRRIELDYDQKNTTLTRPDAATDWTFAPSGDPTDTVRINTLLTRLANLRADRLIADRSDNLAEFGLDNPNSVLTLGLADGTSVKLLIGNQTPVQTGFYVKRESDPQIYMLNAVTVFEVRKLVSDPPVPRPTMTPLPTATPEPAETAPPAETPPAEAIATPVVTPSP